MEDDPTTKIILDQSRFWVQKVFVPLMVVIGVTGNTITVMVLTRRRMRSSTNVYLSALAIADILYLLFVFLLSFVHYNNINDRKYELYWRFYGLTHWLCDAASSTSVWLTVSFTVERYIAVCHPMKGKIFCTENRAKTIIVIVYIFCLATTASTTFEYQLSLTETCVKCPIDPKNLHAHSQNTGNSNNEIGSSNSSSVHHNVIFTNFVSKSELQAQLTKLLSNCSNNHPHIVYVYPQVFNFTSEKNLMEIDKFISTRIPKDAFVLEKRENENVLEKPPGVNSIEENDANQMEVFLNDTTNGNITMVGCCIKKHIGVEPTNLGNNESYKNFIHWYSAIVFCLLPLALIATFNCFLVRAVYLSQKKRKDLTNNSQECISMTNENRITVMLIGVVIMFLVCQTPTASLLIYQNFHSLQSNKAKNTVNILGNLFNLLININASCNFLLYSIMSKKFRSTFRQLFIARAKRQDTILLSSTKSRNSQKFNPHQHGLRRNATAYHTPRNLETQSLTSMPRSKSMITRSPGKAKSTDLLV